MFQFNFVITGTQENPDGNPLPKLKMTGKQCWTPKARKYADYKRHVRNAFWNKLQEYLAGKSQLKNKDLLELCRSGIIDAIGTADKPINLPKGAKCKMDITIYWKDGTHCDPENIFGAIADALFENDKYLAGSFDFSPANTGAGKVLVNITFDHLLSEAW